MLGALNTNDSSYQRTNEWLEIKIDENIKIQVTRNLKNFLYIIVFL